MSDPETPQPQGPVRALDFGRYRLHELGDEIVEIVDVGSAVSGVVVRSGVGGLIVFVATWIAAAAAWGGFGAFLFALVAGLLAAPPAAALGGWLVARNRLEAVTEASGRVVDTVAGMHADVQQLRTGVAGTSVHAVATSLVEDAIVPLVFRTVAKSAGNLLGPLSFVADRLTAIPLRWVEKAVVEAVTLLPDHTIGELAEMAADSAATATMDTTADELGRSALDRLADEYSTLSARLGDIVTQVGRGSAVLGVGLAIITSVPLAIWLLLGWALA